MRKANELGVTLYDTADVYAAGHNEILVGEALKPIRDKVVILTKLNPEVNPIDLPGKGTTAEQIEARLDASLARLDTDYVDIYMFHRVPATVPLAECAEAMAQMMKKGKIRAWAMSRATEEQIREAQAVCPLAVIQNEYSMMVRNPETDGVLKACSEFGIGFTPYMPLAVGFLTGTIKPGQIYKNDDAKRTITWFTDENLRKNQPVLEMLEYYSRKKDATYAQIALAWLMHKYERLVPIPGMYQEPFLYENLKTAGVKRRLPSRGSIPSGISTLIDLDQVASLAPNFEGEFLFPRVAAGAKDFLECGAADAYFGEPARATAANADRQYDIFSDIIVEEVHALV